jgi:hypothetical protein
VCAPPSVSVQQSPQTGARHEAQGPTASALQNVQRAGPSSSTCLSSPVTTRIPTSRRSARRPATRSSPRPVFGSCRGYATAVRLTSYVPASLAMVMACQAFQTDEHGDTGTSGGPAGQPPIGVVPTPGLVACNSEDHAPCKLPEQICCLRGDRILDQCVDRPSMIGPGLSCAELRRGREVGGPDDRRVAIHVQDRRAARRGGRNGSDEEPEEGACQGLGAVEAWHRAVPE